MKHILPIIAAILAITSIAAGTASASQTSQSQSRTADIGLGHGGLVRSGAAIRPNPRIFRLHLLTMTYAG